jgi:hypothetical protein
MDGSCFGVLEASQLDFGMVALQRRHMTRQMGVDGELKLFWDLCGEFDEPGAGVDGVDTSSVAQRKRRQLAKRARDFSVYQPSHGHGQGGREGGRMRWVMGCVYRNAVVCCLRFQLQYVPCHLPSHTPIQIRPPCLDQPRAAHRSVGARSKHRASR